MITTGKLEEADRAAWEDLSGDVIVRQGNVGRGERKSGRDVFFGVSIHERSVTPTTDKTGLPHPDHRGGSNPDREVNTNLDTRSTRRCLT